MSEYCWVPLTYLTAHRRMWKLTPNKWSATNLGMIAEGYTQNPGWHIISNVYAEPDATLPQTMGRYEAMAIAKLLLLSLKQTGSEEQS